MSQPDDRQNNILNDKKYKLFGKRTETGAAALSFDVFRGNISITVFTNDPQDPEKKPIRCAIGPLIGFKSLVSMVHEATQAAPGYSKQLELLTGPPNKTFVDTSIVVGRDNDGIVYIGVRKKGRPSKKFDLTTDVYYNLIDGQGNPLSPGDTSAIWARGFIDAIDSIVSAQAVETYASYDPAQNQKRGQGGGNRGNYQGGGGGNRGGYQTNGGGNNYSNNNNGGGFGDDDIPM